MTHIELCIIGGCGHLTTPLPHQVISVDRKLSEREEKNENHQIQKWKLFPYGIVCFICVYSQLLCCVGNYSATEQESEFWKIPLEALTRCI